MSRRYMIDLAAITSRAEPFIGLMKGLGAVGAQLFIVASPGTTHEGARQILSSLGLPAAEIFVAANDPTDQPAIFAWKANVAKSLQVDLFVCVEREVAETARLLGVPTALFMT